jgi:hypothetical protein
LGDILTSFSSFFPKINSLLFGVLSPCGKSLQAANLKYDGLLAFVAAVLPMQFDISFFLN